MAGHWYLIDRRRRVLLVVGDSIVTRHRFAGMHDDVRFVYWADAIAQSELSYSLPSSMTRAFARLLQDDGPRVNWLWDDQTIREMLETIRLNFGVHDLRHAQDKEKL